MKPKRKNDSANFQKRIPAVPRASFDAVMGALLDSKPKPASQLKIGRRRKMAKKTR